MKSMISLGVTYLLVLTASAASAQTPPFVVAKCGSDAAQVANVRVPHPTLANGDVLAAGSYTVRITGEHPTPATGQSPSGECWVEFVKDGHVVAREVATAVPDSAIGEIAKGPAPRPNTARVDTLKGGEYIRIWFNVQATNYIVHLPVAAARER